MHRTRHIYQYPGGPVFGAGAVGAVFRDIAAENIIHRPLALVQGR